jgi:hypothetical protein
VSAALLLSALAAALIGFCLLRLLWPAEVAIRPYWLIVSAPAIGMGPGERWWSHATSFRTGSATRSFTSRTPTGQ